MINICVDKILLKSLNIHSVGKIDIHKGEVYFFDLLHFLYQYYFLVSLLKKYLEIKGKLHFN